MKTIVITGASSGIGAAAAVEMANRGWRIAVVGRNEARTRAVASAVDGAPFVADFDRLDDVHSLAAQLLERYDRIDVLANNAGGLIGRRGESADGVERTFQHNHLAPFLLTTLLTDRLIDSDARVITTSSVAHRWGSMRLDDLDGRGRPYFGGWPAYANAKLANILFTRELAARTGLSSYAFHPGFVRSEFGAGSPGVMAFVALGSSAQIDPEMGAAPLVHLATATDVGVPNGSYFDRLAPAQRLSRVATDSNAAALWRASEGLVADHQPRTTP